MREGAASRRQAAHLSAPENHHYFLAVRYATRRRRSATNRRRLRRSCRLAVAVLLLQSLPCSVAARHATGRAPFSHLRPAFSRRQKPTISGNRRRAAPLGHEAGIGPRWICRIRGHRRDLRGSTCGRGRAFRDAPTSATMNFLGSWARAHLGRNLPAATFSLSPSAAEGCWLTRWTRSEVHKARSRRTGAMVAMKKIIMHNEKDGVGCSPVAF